MRKRFYPSLLILAVWMFAALMYGQQQVKEITPADVNKLVKKDTSVVLIDVRTEAEYKNDTGHLANSVLIPLQELDKRIGELNKYKGKTIIAYCRTGHRSGIAAAMIQKLGYNVYSMAGGITRWNAENLPVVKEKQ